MPAASGSTAFANFRNEGDRPGATAASGGSMDATMTRHAAAPRRASSQAA
jgi:hypothetical protein